MAKKANEIMDVIMNRDEESLEKDLMELEMSEFMKLANAFKKVVERYQIKP